MFAIPHFFVKPIIDAGKESTSKPNESKEAPLVGIDIHVELIDYCAQIKQTQRFFNKEESALEVSFEFELPKGCAVSSFEADVGERHLTGCVKEKEKAKDDYDDALAAGHSAALMESKDDDPKAFCVQLGNVPPGKEAFVTITYEVLANMEEDKLVLTLNGSDAENVIFAEPPESTPKESDARVKPGFNFDVRIATKTTLKSVSSPSHPITVEFDNGCAIVRLADGANWRENKQFALEAKVEDPHQPSVRLQKANGSLVAMASFYPRIEIRQTKCEMIFVLDRSGSMSGSAIECAKDTLQFFLRSLPLDAFFNIVSFGTHYERFKPESVPFNDENLEAATSYVKQFRANLGGTDIYDPLYNIFKQPIKPGYPRQVFIITDGEVNNKESCIDLVRTNASTTRLFSFGIGSCVDKGLVDGMARAGNGSSTIVRDSSSIRQNVMTQLGRALVPGFNDIHVTWNDISTGKPLPEGSVRQSPANPPPMFRGSRLVSFALLPENCPACKVVLTGSFGDSLYTSEVDVDPSKAEYVPGEQIMKLGVRSMIEDIQNGCGGIPSDNKSAIQKAVIELSVKHNILSKYTAFVAVGSGGETLQGSMVSKTVTRRQYDRPFRSGGGGLFGRRKMYSAPSQPQFTPCRSMAVEAVDRCMDSFAFADELQINKEISDALGGGGDVIDEDELLGELDELDELEDEVSCAPPPRAGKATAKPRSDSYDDDMADLEAALMDCDPAPKPAPKREPKPAPKPASKPEPKFYNQAAIEKQEKRESEKKPIKTPELNLDNVILQQKASGCFNEIALSILGVPSSAINAMPKEAPSGIDEKLMRDVWVTLLVLAGLQKKFAAKSSEWSIIANKSETWAESILGSLYDTWKTAASTAF